MCAVYCQEFQHLPTITKLPDLIPGLASVAVKVEASRLGRDGQIGGLGIQIVNPKATATLLTDFVAAAF